MDNVEQHTEGLAGAQYLCFIHPGLMEMMNGDVGSLVWESQARYRAWTRTLGHSFTGPSHTAQKKRGIYHLTERLSGGKQWFVMEAGSSPQNPGSGMGHLCSAPMPCR